MHIDILDYEIVIDGTVFRFPISYEEIKAVFGEARLVKDETGREFYFYDKEGLVFEPTNIGYLKKQKAYIDNEHIIGSVYVNASDQERLLYYSKERTQNNYVGNITWFGKKDSGFDYQIKTSHVEGFYLEDGTYELAHIGTYLNGDPYTPNYDGDLFIKNLIICFQPRRPKSNENYQIEQPTELCLEFENFNFKLAVINELMYRQEILKPYFDLYDYAEYKKARWNLDTEKNVRGAVKFFQELPIPASMADKVETLEMDGGNEIYMNIAPLWDGEDGRFDLNRVTEKELKQFPNLKSMKVMSEKPDALKKICDPLGIQVEEL